MPDASAPKGPDKDQLKQALKAFRKRLKLVRLDAESNLGGGPLSGGRDCGIVAIQPPNQFPDAVWEELVKQGKLRYVGHGMYELTESTP
jgi:hypothetical protein